MAESKHCYHYAPTPRLACTSKPMHFLVRSDGKTLSSCSAHKKSLDHDLRYGTLQWFEVGKQPPWVEIGACWDQCESQVAS